MRIDRGFRHRIRQLRRSGRSVCRSPARLCHSAASHETIERLLRNYRIKPLHVLVVAVTTLSGELSKTPPTLEHCQRLGRATEPVATERNSIHQWECRSGGAGSRLRGPRVGHGISRAQDQGNRSADYTIPVELTAIEVGPSEHGREMVSIDISEYGDPLYSRMLRVPFSIYLKPWQQRWAFDAQVLGEPPASCRYSAGKDYVAGGNPADARFRRGPGVGRSIPSPRFLTRRASMRKLIDDYERSNVAKFHEWFYSQEPHPA